MEPYQTASALFAVIIVAITIVTCILIKKSENIDFSNGTMFHKDED